jgi:hypothetical protein
MSNLHHWDYKYLEKITGMKKKKEFIIDRSKSKHAVHPLSKRPGGAAVCVEYSNGEVRTYTNVKHPESYMKRIWEGNVNGNIIDVYIKDGLS